MSMLAIYFMFQSSLPCLPHILVSTLPHNLLEGRLFGIWEGC